MHRLPCCWALWDSIRSLKTWSRLSVRFPRLIFNYVPSNFNQENSFCAAKKLWRKLNRPFANCSHYDSKTSNDWKIFQQLRRVKSNDCEGKLRFNQLIEFASDFISFGLDPSRKIWFETFGPWNWREKISDAKGFHLRSLKNFFRSGISLARERVAAYFTEHFSFIERAKIFFHIFHFLARAEIGKMSERSTRKVLRREKFS